MRFEMTTQGTITVLRPDGILSFEHLPDFAEALAARTATGQPRVVIDMSSVLTLDSAAMELLVDAQQACLSRGGVIKLVGLNALCREILQINGVARRFEQFENQIAALGSFAA